MDPLAFALEAVFADALVAEAATLHPADGGPSIAVRVVRRDEDRISDWGGARLLAGSVVLEIRVAEAPALDVGDRLAVAGEVYEIAAAPARDGFGAVWRAEARKARQAPADLFAEDGALVVASAPVAWSAPLVGGRAIRLDPASREVAVSGAGGALSPDSGRVARSKPLAGGIGGLEVPS